MEDYINLVKKKFVVWNKPITFTEKNFDKTKKYLVSEKIDGERKLLFFNGVNVYSINNKFQFKIIKLTKEASKLKNVLLDCEYHNKKYYVIDILFDNNGIDIRYNTSIENRLAKAEKIIKILNSKKVILSNPKKINCSSFDLSQYKNRLKEGDLDGLIFIPSKGNYYTPMLKWKPSHLLSNDFKIKTEGDYMFLLLQNNTIFSPKGYPDIGKVLNTGNFKNGSVVEFYFDKGRFIPLRQRKDKTKSNGTNVIYDNFNEMINPTDIIKLLC
jgi:hypothetical protein